AYPLLMVRPERFTTLFEQIRKTRLSGNRDLSAATTRLPGPGPRIVTLFETKSSPLVKVIVAGVSSNEKSIVSPSLALASAARKLSGPSSAMSKTVMVVGGGPEGPRLV